MDEQGRSELMSEAVGEFTLLVIYLFIYFNLKTLELKFYISIPNIKFKP